MTQRQNEDPTPAIAGGNTAAAVGTSSTQKVANYILRRKLGEGGMGEVWLAHDRLLDRDVALKLLKPEIAADERRLREFLSEARATAKLNHPNIVTIFQVSRKDDRVFIAMEYVERGSLSDELRDRGVLPWREATQAIRDAAAGLGVAHAAGLVHRDIKPSNLMRSSRGRTKVVDFGLARSDSDPQLTQTTPGTLTGSPAYMSPEQCRGQRVDLRSDLYSLTCSYYQLLTGELPFNGPDLPAMMYQHCHDPFPDAGKKVMGLPAGVLGILARGSQKNPQDRYASAAELLIDLRAVLMTADVSGAPGGPAADRMPAAPSTPSAGSGRTSSEQAPRRRAAQGIVAILKGRGLIGKLTWAGAVAVLAVVLAVALHRSPAAGKSSPAKFNLQAQTRPSADLAFGPDARDFTNTLGMKFVRIEPGEFMMGSPVGEEGRFAPETRHRLKLTRAFMMASTLVTQSQWKSVMGDNPSKFQGDNLPVEMVSWNDAAAFCKKLTEKEGKKYRLPTEAQWEYACRAGTTTAYYTGGGETALNEAGWYNANSELKTHPVGQKKPNAWGLYDMHGNVWQWCSDYSGDYLAGDAVDPGGLPAGDKDASRVLRGGSWHNAPLSCRAAYRGWIGPDGRFDIVGFRLCLDF